MAANEPDQVCVVCGRNRKAGEFFKQKNGERIDTCKDCLSMGINNSDPETFLPILKRFDVPYIEKTWIEIANKAYAKNPKSFGSRSVIGTYLRQMCNMAQYKQYTYADTEKLTKEYKMEQENAERIREANKARWQKQLQAGALSQEEYNRLMAASELSDDSIPNFDAVSANNSAIVGFAGSAIPTEDDWMKQLTEDDIKYLAIKWGSTYKPSEWIAMEKMYIDYSDEFELSVDREQVLKTICKLQLKMDQALDIDDTQTVLKLTQAQDQLRRSAKFTDAQNKEEKQREIDSLGELVRYVELKEGAIPLYDDPIEYPKDQIDWVIKDMKNYTTQLVYGDLGLGNLIESYIKKMEEKNKQDKDIMDSSFSALKQRDEAISSAIEQEFAELPIDKEV